MVKLEEGKIYCAKCDEEMIEILLPRYEYEDGYVLHNVSSFRCNKCGQVFFTEEQAKQLEIRTTELKEYQFGFERKVGISGRSLIVTIPQELADNLRLKKGSNVKVLPMAKDGFMVKKS